MKGKKKNIERRASPRFDISLPIIYNMTIPPFKHKLKIRALTKDISAGGIGFVGSNKITSPIMNLQIGLPAKGRGAKSTKFRFISAKVRIVYSQPIAKGHKDILRTGACFVELSKNDMILLKKLLDGIK